jgi:glycosyltransferase involved in cell wall biosynthesis
MIEKPLRVAILQNEIMPYRLPLFRQLAAVEGIDFRVFFCEDRSPVREWALSNFDLSFPYRMLPGFAIELSKPNYSEKRRVLVNPGLMLELVRYRPKVVIGYEYSLPAITALLYTRLSGARYFVWTEGTDHSERLLTFGQRWTRRIIIPRARAFLATSRAGTEHLVKLGAPADRVYLAPQPHNIRWIRNDAENGRILKDIRQEKFVLYVGFLSQRKGVDLLLDAFEQVAAAEPAARLLIAGRGPLMKPMKARVARAGLSERVKFLGFLEPSEIPRLYGNVDAFVLPSLEDTFGVVVVEALAGGVPVVCSKFAGVSSHLVDGQDAFIVNPLETDQLADRITRLLSDPDLRRHFVENGRKVAEQFDARNVAARFVEAIQAAR